MQGGILSTKDIVYYAARTVHVLIQYRYMYRYCKWRNSIYLTSMADTIYEDAEYALAIIK